MDTDILRRRLEGENKTLRRLMSSLGAALGPGAKADPATTPSFRHTLLAALQDVEQLADSIRIAELQELQAAREWSATQVLRASIEQQTEETRTAIGQLQQAIAQAQEHAAQAQEYDEIARDILALPDPERVEEQIANLTLDLAALQREAEGLDAAMAASKRTILTLYHVLDGVQVTLRDGMAEGIFAPASAGEGGGGGASEVEDDGAGGAAMSGLGPGTPTRSPSPPAREPEHGEIVESASEEVEEGEVSMQVDG